MASLNDIFNEAVGSGIKLKYDAGAQLNLQVGKKFLRDMDLEYDAKALQMIKVIRKELVKAESDPKESAKVVKAYRRMLKKYSKEYAG
jgi:hypothetical protein